MAKIMILLDGGAVQSVRGDADAAVLLVDLDDIRADEHDNAELDLMLRRFDEEYPLELPIGRPVTSDYRKAQNV
jgi:hypothetical protein